MHQRNNFPVKALKKAGYSSVPFFSAGKYGAVFQLGIFLTVSGTEKYGGNFLALMKYCGTFLAAMKYGSTSLALMQYLSIMF